MSELPEYMQHDYRSAEECRLREHIAELELALKRSVAGFGVERAYNAELQRQIAAGLELPRYSVRLNSMSLTYAHLDEYGEYMKAVDVQAALAPKDEENETD
jgi:hypothetical protein